MDESWSESWWESWWDRLSSEQRAEMLLAPGELADARETIEAQAAELDALRARLRRALMAPIAKPHRGPCGCGECIGAYEAHRALARRIRAALDGDGEAGEDGEDG